VFLRVFRRFRIVPVALKRGEGAGEKLLTGACGETIFRNVRMRLFRGVPHIGGLRDGAALLKAFAEKAIIFSLKYGYIP
jgi:hypothetical protein